MENDIRPTRSVPGVVGLPFSIGRKEAESYGVALANPDPDGPSIGALAWPADPVIVAQEPAAGAHVREWDSVKVWLQGGPDMPAAPRSNPLDVDSAHASPRAAPVEIDLTTNGAHESDDDHLVSSAGH